MNNMINVFLKANVKIMVLALVKKSTKFIIMEAVLVVKCKTAIYVRLEILISVRFVNMVYL